MKYIRAGVCLLVLLASLLVPRNSLGAELDPPASAARTAPLTQGHAPQAGGSVLYLPWAMSGPPSPGWVLVTSEDFEGADSLWQFSDADGAANGEYRWASRTCRPYAGSHSGWAAGGGADGAALACGANHPDNARSWMVYGPFSLVGAAAAQLEFKAWFNGVWPDRLCYGADSDAQIDSGVCLTAQTGGWTSLVLDLGSEEAGSQLGQPQVWVGLLFLSDSSGSAAEGAYVDDVVVRRCIGEGCTSSTYFWNR